MKPTLVPAVHQQLVDTIVEALNADPTAVAALADAREIVVEHLRQVNHDDLLVAPPMPPASLLEFIHLVDFATERIIGNEAIASVVPESTLRRLIVQAAAGQPTNDEPLRFLGLPGIEGRPLWNIVTQRDADALRTEIAPGQVWVRADLLTAQTWPRVRSMATENVRQMGLQTPPGRRKGSRNAVRQPILDAIAARPEMTNAEIQAFAAQIWERHGLADDYDSRRRRAKRLKDDATR